MALDDEYINALISLLSDHSYDILIPGTDIELPKISQSRDHIESHTRCKVLVSSSSVIDIANDKYLTYEFLRNNSFNPPRT